MLINIRHIYIHISLGIQNYDNVTMCITCILLHYYMQFTACIFITCIPTCTVCDSLK